MGFQIKFPYVFWVRPPSVMIFGFVPFMIFGFVPHFLGCFEFRLVSVKSKSNGIGK